MCLGQGIMVESSTLGAIVCANIMAVMVAISVEVVERLGYNNDTEDEAADLQDMLEDIRHLQTDSTGRDIVIY